MYTINPITRRPSLGSSRNAPSQIRDKPKELLRGKTSTPNLSVILYMLVSCGGELNDLTGEIKSPRFPLNYPNQAECIWKIIGSRGSRITVTFTDFEVGQIHWYNNLVPRAFWVFFKTAGRSAPFWKIPRRPWGRGCCYNQPLTPEP